MMQKIIENSIGHLIRDIRVPKSDELPCVVCSLGKLITRLPSINKIAAESPTFLEGIQADIWGPINLPCRPFRFFMVLIDA